MNLPGKMEKMRREGGRERREGKGVRKEVGMWRGRREGGREGMFISMSYPYSSDPKCLVWVRGQRAN